MISRRRFLRTTASASVAAAAVTGTAFAVEAASMAPADAAALNLASLERVGFGSPNAVNIRANAMLAEYMAIEVEQHRLGEINANDPQISLLADRAIAIADELPDLHDPAGNADLAAACVLVEMMLQRHDWSRFDEIEFGQDDRDALAVLSALAGATTGVVREQTRRILLKKGHDIGLAPSTPDPLADLVAAYNAEVAAEDALSDEELNALSACPAFDALSTAPAASTLAGVAAALRLIVSEEARDRNWHQRTSSDKRPSFIERAVLPFFEGRTV